MGTTVQNFVQKYLPTAQAVGQQTGLSPDFILGVAGEELGWGQHFVGNNLFGIGGSNSATYATPEASFSAFGSLITTSPNYANVVAAGGDAQAEALALGQSPYNPSGAAYGAKVSATTGEVAGITGGDPGSGVATGVPTVPGTPGSTTQGAANLAAGVTSSSFWGEIAIRGGLVAIGLGMILGGVYLMGRRVSL